MMSLYSRQVSAAGALGLCLLGEEVGCVSRSEMSSSLLKSAKGLLKQLSCGRVDSLILLVGGEGGRLGQWGANVW